MEFLYRVYACTREEEMAAVPWTDEQKAAFLRQQFNAQYQYYQGHFPDASYQVIQRDDEPIGRLYKTRHKQRRSMSRDRNA
jgi:hypothetical protein